MKNLLFFSGNQDKIIEIKKIFKNRNKKILSLNDFPKVKMPKETGREFVVNAKIKSLYGFKQFRIPCFADDSGICISALNNKPGIHSKRFFEKFQNKKELFKYIIKKVYISKNASAYFTTIICFTLKIGHYVIFEGKISGNIAEIPRGRNGFGYDPVFLIQNENKTFAEMTIVQKEIHSHRGKAIRAIIKLLIPHLKNSRKKEIA